MSSLIPGEPAEVWAFGAEKPLTGTWISVYGAEDGIVEAEIRLSPTVTTKVRVMRLEDGRIAQIDERWRMAVPPLPVLGPSFSIVATVDVPNPKESMVHESLPGELERPPTDGDGQLGLF